MAMKTVTMLEFRQNAEVVLRRVARGERLVLSYRGKPAARIEPFVAHDSVDSDTDPFLSISRRVKPSLKGKTEHEDIDRLIYGRG